MLVVRCDRDCRLPPLVVVGRPDGILPLSATHGTTVVRLPSPDLIAGRRALIRLRVPRRGVARLACFVDPNAPPQDGSVPVTLVRARRKK